MELYELGCLQCSSPEDLYCLQLAYPAIKAKKILDTAFKPVVNIENVEQLAMIAYDDEEKAAKMVLSLAKTLK